MRKKQVYLGALETTLTITCRIQESNHILVDVTAEALVHTLADTAAEGEAEDTWRHCD